MKIQLTCFERFNLHKLYITFFTEIVYFTNPKSVFNELRQCGEFLTISRIALKTAFNYFSKPT